jgi:RNA polymerase sigma factor (sigma-70 family)
LIPSARPERISGQGDEMETTPEQRQRNSVFSQDEIKGLYSFVRDRLAYHETVGDLNPGDVAAEDIAGTVLLRAYRELANRSEDDRGKEPRERTIGPWLRELATKQIQWTIDRIKAVHSRSIALEEDIPETPPAEEVSTLGEEVLYFYQPDEDLRVEDIFPDMDMATPEEFVAAKEELLHCVNTALAGMPIQWRRAMRLRYAGGLTSAQLAEVLAEDEPQVERVLEYAREHLRQTLVAAGCTFIGKRTGSSSS